MQHSPLFSSPCTRGNPPLYAPLSYGTNRLGKYFVNIQDIPLSSQKGSKRSTVSKSASQQATQQVSEAKREDLLASFSSNHNNGGDFGLGIAHINEGSTSAQPLRKPEVLAPAGGWPQLRAAVENGADAVYFGLFSFNARARAANFAPEELEEVLNPASAWCHGSTAC